MLRGLAARVRGLLLRSRANAEADEEIQFHLEMEKQANIARGMTPIEARRVALRDLGGMTQTREAVGDVRATFLDSVYQDLRFALRSFRRNPGFTAVAIVILALGIAANTTIFSLVNATLFRPLQVPAARDLKFLSVVFARHPDVALGVPYRAFQQLEQRHDVFSGIAGFYHEEAKIGTGLTANQVQGERVTSGYFDVLGAGAALGRTFASSDDDPAAAPAVIVSDQFWRRRLNGNPNVVGTTIDLRSPLSFDNYYSRHHRTYTVVGVMPPGFNGLSSAWWPAEYWVPLQQRMADLFDAQVEDGLFWMTSVEQSLNVRGLMLVARLKPGVTDAALRTVVLAAERDMPDTGARGTRLEKGTIVCAAASRRRLPFDPMGTAVAARLALTLMVVSGMVLLIAATNLAGILLARGVTRRSEVGVRLALGAGRARVARQVLTENILLSLSGAIAALAFARAFIALFLAYMPGRIGFGPSTMSAISLDVPIDVRVLLFTMTLGIAAGMLVGLTPALQALRTDVMAALAGGSNAVPATARSRVRRWIVVPQICLSIVLLLAAGVLVRALLQAELADRGFDPSGVVYADFAMPKPIFTTMTAEQRRAEDAHRKTLYTSVLEQVRALPGVERAALATKSSWDVWANRQAGVPVVPRYGYGSGQHRWAAAAEVSSDYFEAMGIPIVRGRAFDARDTATTTPVAIVCERLAQVLWPDKEPVGEYIANDNPSGGKGAPSWLLVVGVAREVKLPGNEDRTTSFLYLPLAQRPWMPFSPTSIVVRGRGSSRGLLKTLAEAIVAAHPEVEVPRARTLDEEIGEALYPRRLGAAILALSGLFGLLLSTVGLYGVVSYSAAQRLREIGIRTALGAERRDIVALLLRDGMLVLGIAVGCGVALGFAAVRIVSSLVIALPAMDALTLVAVPALLSAVILAACLLPARRAARVNPIDVLRAQ